MPNNWDCGPKGAIHVEACPDTSANCPNAIGHIHYSKWTDKNGKDCYGCEIIAEQVDFLAKAKETNTDTTENPEPKASKRRSK